MVIFHTSMFKGEVVPECASCRVRGASIPESEMHIWKSKHRCEAEA